MRSMVSAVAVTSCVRRFDVLATRAPDALGVGGGASGTQMPMSSSRSRSRVRTSRTGPSATRTPSASRTSIRSTRSTHGPRRCSTTTVVIGYAASAPSTLALTWAAWPGSSMAVGSSSSSTLGRNANAPARASRCVSPPDRAPVGVSSGMVSPTAATAERMAGGMSARGIPTFSRPNATSRPIDDATTPAPGSWRTRPTSPARDPGAWPSMTTDPDSSPASAVSSSPAIARSSVDLPDPDSGRREARARPAPATRDVAQDRFAPTVRAPRHPLEGDVAARDRLSRAPDVRQRGARGAPGRAGTR